MRLLIIALLCVSAVFADGCTAQVPGGPSFDLSAVQRDKKTPWDVTFSSGTDKWQFFFDLCGNLDPSFTANYPDCDAGGHLPAQTIQIDIYDQCKKISVGTPSVSYDATTKTLNMTYVDGDYCYGAQHNRQIHFLMKCADQETDPLIVEDPPKSCYYNVNWNTKAACPVGGAGGVSFGTVALILVIVGLAGLFAGGFFWQKFKVHASGKDLIIFLPFWMSIPGLCWDGMKFVFHLCTFCCRKSGYAAL